LEKLRNIGMLKKVIILSLLKDILKEELNKNHHYLMNHKKRFAQNKASELHIQQALIKHMGTLGF
jgi:galactose-1-phosphate uridylyltransferase